MPLFKPMSLSSSLVAALLCTLSPLICSLGLAADTFDPNTGHISIPKIVAGNGASVERTIFGTNITITVKDVISYGESYPLSSAVLTVKPDFYDTALNQLFIPQIVVGDKVHEDLIITIGEVVSISGEIEDWPPPAYSTAEILQPLSYNFADDIPQSARENWKVGLEAMAEYFGRYGPTEMYIVGKDAQAMERLIDRFCENRKLYNQESMDAGSGPWGRDCKAYGEAFEEYRQKGLNGQYGAAHAGLREFGFHWIISAYPGYFDEEQSFGFNNPMHEYYHVTQMAQINTKGSAQEYWEVGKPDEDAKMGLGWWVEGTATLLTNYAVFQMQADGRLPLLGNAKYDFYGNLANTLRSSKEAWNQGLRLDEKSFNYSVWYEMGSWAVALLLSQKDYGALEHTFYPNLGELGWEGAFVKTFGKSSSVFFDEFATFINKPKEEQMAILPGWSSLSTEERQRLLQQ